MRPGEFILSLMAMSLIRLAVGTIPVSLLAIVFFGFNVWSLGLGFAVFFANLILTSWSIGLVCSGLVLRYGLAAESLVWTIMFLLQPLACVFYPVATLPIWLRGLAWTLPPTYVFEGLRQLLSQHILRLDLIGEAFALNAALFCMAVFAFLRLLHAARRAGTLLQVGE